MSFIWPIKAQPHNIMGFMLFFLIHATEEQVLKKTLDIAGIQDSQYKKSYKCIYKTVKIREEISIVNLSCI